MPHSRFHPSKELIANRFSKQLQSYDLYAEGQRKIAKELFDLIVQYRPPKSVASLLEIGVGSGFLTKWLSKQYATAHLTLNDIAPRFEVFLEKRLARHRGEITYIQQDIETFAFTSSYDLIASSSTLHWLSNPREMLFRCMESLTPNGLLACNFFLKDNFEELNKIIELPSPYLTAEECLDILGPSSLLHHELRTQQLYFSSPVEILRHISRTGVNVLGEVAFPPSTLRQVEQIYPRKADGSCPLTFSYLNIIAHKR